MPSKNPRYLQDRPDVVKPMDRYVAEMGTRFAAKIPAHQPVHLPVNAVLSGRRNNPPEKFRASAAWPSITPSITRNCPNCSWTIMFADGQESLDDRRRQRRGVDQGAVQRRAPLGRHQRGAGLDDPHGLPGYSTAAGSYRAEVPAFDHDISLLGARSLVPHVAR